MKNRMNGNGIESSIRKLLIVTVSIILIIVLVGCGSSSNNDSASNSKSEAVAMDLSKNREMSPAAAAMYDTKSEPGVSVTASEISNSSMGAATEDFSAYDRKLIYNAHVVLEVGNYGEGQSQLLNMVSLAGGYMLNFNDTQSKYEIGGSFVVKIPSKGFYSFVTKLEELKKKDAKFERNIEGNDVTEEYVDIESRLKAKQVVEARLLDFMNRATDTKNLLEFSNQLAIVQEEIEAIKGRMRYIDQNVAFSTVDIRMYQRQGDVASQEEKEDHVLNRAGHAMKASGKAVLAMLEGTLVVLAGSLPILIVIGVIVVAIIVMNRNIKYRGARENKKAKYGVEVNKEQLAVQPKSSDLIASKQDEQGEIEEK